MTNQLPAPASGFQDDLLQQIREAVGHRYVLDDASSMEPFLKEERGLFKGEAIAIVRPGTTHEVSKVVAACYQADIPVIPLGGRTGLTGGGVSTPGQRPGIVLSLDRMSAIRMLDKTNQTVEVEAGCILENLHNHLDDFDLLYPLDLGARGSCTIGGNIATNAGGMQVLRYGNTRDLVLGLEVVLADGSIMNAMRGLRKDNTGYDLKQLFIGSEGTLGVITGAVLKLFPKPRCAATAFLAVPDISSAVRLLQFAKRLYGESLNTLELVEKFGVDVSCRHGGATYPFEADYPCFVLMEISCLQRGKEKEMEDFLSDAYEEGLVQDAVIANSEQQRLALWKLREALSDKQHHEGASIKHDISVPISKIAEFVVKAKAAVLEQIPGARPFAFGHIGDGNVHFNVSQPVGMDPTRFLEQTKAVYAAVHEIAAGLNGSISAEHGIGQLKIGDLAMHKSAVELQLMKTLKVAIDPKNIMNPGKIFQL